MRPLFDRALCVFAHRWNELAERKLSAAGVPTDLALAAADAYAALCALHPMLRAPGEPPWPTPLHGLDLARLAQTWPLDRALSAAAASECHLSSSAEEAEAERLWREYVQAVNDGRKDDAIARLDTLLGPLRTTARVRARVAQLTATRAQLATVVRLATRAEEQRRARFRRTCRVIELISGCARTPR